MSDFTPDETETPVLFRAQMEAGSLWVTAVFPCEPNDISRPDMFTVYQHVGQHGGGSLGWYHGTRAAKPDEYADLQRELESAPYGYRFKVYKRMQPWMREARHAEARRLREHPSRKTAKT